MLAHQARGPASGTASASARGLAPSLPLSLSPPTLLSLSLSRSLSLFLFLSRSRSPWLPAPLACFLATTRASEPTQPRAPRCWPSSLGAFSLGGHHCMQRVVQGTRALTGGILASTATAGALARSVGGTFTQRNVAAAARSIADGCAVSARALPGGGLPRRVGGLSRVAVRSRADLAGGFRRRR